MKKTEEEKAATKIFNALLLLTNFGGNARYDILAMVERRMASEGFDSISRMLQAAGKVIS